MSSDFRLLVTGRLVHCWLQGHIPPCSSPGLRVGGGLAVTGSGPGGSSSYSYGRFTRSQNSATFQKMQIFAHFWNNNNKRMTKRWVESSVEMCPQAFFGLYGCSNRSFTEQKNKQNKQVLFLSFRGSYVLYICTFVTKHDFREFFIFLCEAPVWISI